MKLDDYQNGKAEYPNRVLKYGPYVKGWKNYSGHAHSIPGLWDSDNGKKAGMPCFACMCLNIELGNFNPNDFIEVKDV